MTSDERRSRHMIGEAEPEPASFQISWGSIVLVVLASLGLWAAIWGVVKYLLASLLP
jgi:hypothetical protein